MKMPPGRHHQFRCDHGQRYNLHQQILELWPVVDDRTNEPTFRVNLQIEVSHLLEYRADQVIAVATAAQRQGHLGIEYCHEVSGDAVVRDGDTGRRVHLKPVQLHIIANGIGLHQVLIGGRGARAQHTTIIFVWPAHPTASGAACGSAPDPI